MSVSEDRLRQVVDADTRAVVPPVEQVIDRGRRIRRRRWAWVGSAGAVVVLGAGLLTWPGVGPVQVVAGGSSITAAPDGRGCQVVARDAGPKAADGLRVMPDPATIPPGLGLDVAGAAQANACPRAAGPLVLVGYDTEHRTVRRTFAVWGPGADADSFGFGDATGAETVRGRRATAYGANHGRPIQALSWTERGERWLAIGHGLPPGELERMVQALRIHPGTGTVSLPEQYLAGFDRTPVVPEFAGAASQPDWTVLYNARGHHVGQLSITVSRVSESLDAMLLPGMRITTVRGHRGAATTTGTPPHHVEQLMWEERPGVLVMIIASGFADTWPDLFRVAESLHPIPANDPRITR